MKTIRGELNGHKYEIEVEYMRAPSSELAQRFIAGAKVVIDSATTPTINQDPIFKECASHYPERSEQSIIKCVEEYILLKFSEPN